LGQVAPQNFAEVNSTHSFETPAAAGSSAELAKSRRRYIDPMRRRLLFLGLLLLTGCHRQPLALPLGWPLPQLAPPADARPLPLARLAAADRPYYYTGNDDSFQPAKAALERLTAAVPPGAAGDPGYSFGPLAAHSADGTPGTAWGIAYTGRGWDSSLAQCEAALKPLRYAIQEYRPGRLRTYYSRDRRTEVDLVAGKADQLLLCIVRYDPPLPGERELAEREDLQHAARAIAEQVRLRAREIGLQRP
jgi:hypothetical protein